MGTIAEKLNYLNATKTNIKNAIIEKGVEVSDNDTFRSYASKIADIEPTLGTKTITANGTYNASDDSLQGYSSVTVDIDDTDLYRDTTDSTYESVKTLSNCGAFPMLSLTAEINAVQDLHGYDKPWAGGAGKNKLPLNVSNIKANNTNGTWSGNAYTENGVTFSLLTDDGGNITGIKTNGTASANIYFVLSEGELNWITFDGSYVVNGCTDGSSTTYAIQVYSNESSGIRIDNFNQDNYIQSSNSTYTIKNVTIVIRNGYTASNLMFYPMIRLASVADATFAPYTNICPITGWDSIDVYQSGVNVWDEEWEAGGFWGDGTPRADFNGIRSKNYILTSPNLTLSATFPFSFVFFYDKDKAILSYAVTNTTFTTPANCAYFKFATGLKDGAYYGTTYNSDISINYPSTDTEYHAYAGKTYTIQLGDTIYGGSVDVVNGTSGNIRTKAGVDLDSLTWTNLDISGGIHRYQATIDDMKTKDARSMNIECSCYKPNIGGGAYDDGTIYNVSSPNRLVIATSLYSNITDFQNSLSGQKVVYELATPRTYQVTPTQVKLLLGTNNIRANSGDVGDARYFKKVEL